MRPGFFVRFFASLFDLQAEHFRSFFTSTAAAEQPTRASWGPRGGSLEPSGGPESSPRAPGGPPGGHLGAPRSLWEASSWGLLGELRKALGALLGLGDKTRRCTAPTTVFAEICRVSGPSDGLGQLSGRLKGSPSRPGRLLWEPRSAAEEACSELEGSVFEPFRAKRPRSGPSETSAPRANQIKSP